MQQSWQDLKSGSSLGITPWFQLKQEMFNEFETLTLSNDPLHIDPQWVADNTHFKSTIAPGFFVVGLLPYFHAQVTADMTGYYPLNYGFDKIRWVEPVPVNSRIRAEFIVMEVTPRPDGGSLFKTKVTVEIEGIKRPGMVAEWLGVVMPKTRH
jgi:acyl dehydratase